MGRVTKSVQSNDLKIEGSPPKSRRLRSNLNEEQPAAPAVLTHEDAPVQRTRRVPAAKAPAPAPTSVTTQGYVKILIEENENIPPTGMFVGLNGRGFLVMPGVPVSVPPGVLEILNNAVEKMAVIDPQTRQVVSYRDRMRYPYRLAS